MFVQQIFPPHTLECVQERLWSRFACEVVKTPAEHIFEADTVEISVRRLARVSDD